MTARDDHEDAIMEQMLREARDRYGPNAAVRTCYNPRAPYQVGVWDVGPRGGRKFRQLGCGLTWERAFLSADNRAQRPRRARTRKKTPPPKLQQLCFPW